MLLIKIGTLIIDPNGVDAIWPFKNGDEYKSKLQINGKEFYCTESPEDIAFKVENPDGFGINHLNARDKLIGEQYETIFNLQNSLTSFRAEVDRLVGENQKLIGDNQRLIAEGAKNGLSLVKEDNLPARVHETQSISPFACAILTGVSLVCGVLGASIGHMVYNLVMSWF